MSGKNDFDNNDKWDSRELGASEEHVEVASDEEMAAFDSALVGK